MSRYQLKKRLDAPGVLIDCGEGWVWILEDLHEKLVFLDPKYTVWSVKEKYGTLRVYLGNGGKVKNIAIKLMHDALTYAEWLSAKTCEICGNCSHLTNPERGIALDSTVGLKVNEFGWYKTLCGRCAEQFGYKVEEDA